MKMEVLQKSKSRQRLHFFTPLRYPGGKAKISGFVKRVIEANGLLDGEYVEPYAGGAGIALELLVQEYVRKIHINDVSRPIYAFWKSIFDHTDEFTRLVRNTKVTISTWNRQKKILAHPDDHGDLKLGFATFFLNRTNRSGILNGGVIGGKDQTGPWKIDARYNVGNLIYRIESIAKFRRRVSLSCEDALEFMGKRLKSFPEKTLIYLDPPYYVKGKDLYLDFYTQSDHASIAKFVAEHISRQKWIVSYDNVAPIRNLYSNHEHIIYELGYSAREVRKGSEVMFFCDSLKIPERRVFV